MSVLSSVDSRGAPHWPGCYLQQIAEQPCCHLTTLIMLLSSLDSRRLMFMCYVQQHSCLQYIQCYLQQTAEVQQFHGYLAVAQLSSVDPVLSLLQIGSNTMYSWLSCSSIAVSSVDECYLQQTAEECNHANSQQIAEYRVPCYFQKIAEYNGFCMHAIFSRQQNAIFKRHSHGFYIACYLQQIQCYIQQTAKYVVPWYFAVHSCLQQIQYYLQQTARSES